MKKLLFVLIMLGMLGCGLPSFVSPTPTPTVTPTPEIDSEQTYYLGFFQGCVGVVLGMHPEVSAIDLCKSMLLHYYGQDLYENKRLPKGWYWPPPVPTSTPTPHPVGSVG